MSFISVEFFILLLVVVLLCGRLPHRWQNRLLLVASYFFYGWWDWRFLGLILFSSFVDFACGLALGREGPAKTRKAVAAISILTNLGLLGFFKYYGFFVTSLQDALALADIPFHTGTLDIILPVGISFYTFQSMSYTVDVYRGQLSPTRNLEDFLLYVSFFPQLVAGPIERATRLLPQIQSPRTIDVAGITDGAQLLLFGLFKKMVIADNLAVYVDSVFDGAGHVNGFSAVLATYAFAFQIYGDFSGYTDIARGAARMLGFDLCKNFDKPYLATNPSDFWQRWHISLSSWLRDYLYIPLGGNRHGSGKTARNLMLTMLLGGLWHGAANHFVLWGLYHGVLLALFRPFSRREGRPRTGPLFWLKVFLFFQLTCVGWLIFRVEDIAQLLTFITAVAHWGTPPITAPVYSSLAIVLTYVVPVLLFDIYRDRVGHPEPWKRWSAAGQSVFIVVLFYAVVLLGAPSAATFIYFQF